MTPEYQSPILVPDHAVHIPEADGFHIQFPYQSYDAHSASLWTQWIQSGSLEEKTLHVIHTVSEGEKPIRWLTNIVDIAELIEELQDHGITPPEKVKLMGLIHTNAAANNGNDHHVELALKQAEILRRLAEEYLDAFHPTVWIDFEYDFDSSEIVPNLLRHGKDLYPRLPQDVAQTLSKMAEKYNRNPTIGNHEFGAAYLLAHNGAYRRFTNQFGPFAPCENGIYALPQSEGIFVDMLQASDEAVNSLGLSTKSTSENVFLLSNRNRISHYYAVSGIDPTLEDIVMGNPWPNATEILSGKSFDKARRDAINGIKVIERDTRERGGVPRLIEIIKDAHNKAM